MVLLTLFAKIDLQGIWHKINNVCVKFNLSLNPPQIYFRGEQRYATKGKGLYILDIVLCAHHSEIVACLNRRSIEGYCVACMTRFGLQLKLATR